MNVSDHKDTRYLLAEVWICQDQFIPINKQWIQFFLIYDSWRAHGFDEHLKIR